MKGGGVTKICRKWAESTRAVQERWLFSEETDEVQNYSSCFLAKNVTSLELPYVHIDCSVPHLKETLWTLPSTVTMLYVTTYKGSYLQLIALICELDHRSLKLTL